MKRCLKAIMCLLGAAVLCAGCNLDPVVYDGDGPGDAFGINIIDGGDADAGVDSGD